MQGRVLVFKSASQPLRGKSEPGSLANRRTHGSKHADAAAITSGITRQDRLVANHARARPSIECCSAGALPHSGPAAGGGGNCMEDLYDALAARAADGYYSRTTGSTSRYVIGVAGGPGSGKSTLAREVVKRINVLEGTEVAVSVPMDGFHYYRRELDSMPDPAQAHARRGAHWTFDAAAYVECVRRVKGKAGEALSAPAFNHGVGDPVEGGIKVLPKHKIVVSEGNYLLLDMEPWSQLLKLFDDTWFIECDIDTAMQRVYERQTGHGVPPAVSRQRISGNDRPNAELIETTKGNARLVVPSLPFRQQKA